jgi:hypothetical protein
LAVDWVAVTALNNVFGFDRFVFGTYAEYKCIPEEGMLTIKPTSVASGTGGRYVT